MAFLGIAYKCVTESHQGPAQVSSSSKITKR